MSYWVDMKPEGLPEHVYRMELRKRTGRRFWEKHERTMWWRFVASLRGLK